MINLNNTTDDEIFCLNCYISSQRIRIYELIEIELFYLHSNI